MSVVDADGICLECADNPLTDLPPIQVIYSKYCNIHCRICGEPARPGRSYCADHPQQKRIRRFRAKSQLAPNGRPRGSAGSCASAHQR